MHGWIKLQIIISKTQIKNNSQRSKYQTITSHIFVCLILFFPQSRLSQFLANPDPGSTDVDSSQTVQSRFHSPAGFHRVAVSPNSFGNYLRNMKLLPAGAPVKDYRGRIKVAAEDSTVAAVLDYDIRGKKLEQCMDIIIRFYAEYLISQGREDEIAFYLPVNFLLKWNDWKQGFRPVHRGIKINLIKNKPADSSRHSFDEYLNEIFYHSNTQTAYFNYRRVEFDDIQIGDFIVKKGRRGHAVLILDLAVDSLGNKVALIGQGDTPARQFYLMNCKKNQAWFPLKFEDGFPPLPIRKKMYWKGLRRFSNK